MGQQVRALHAFLTFHAVDDLHGSLGVKLDAIGNVGEDVLPWVSGASLFLFVAGLRPQRLI